MNDESLNNKNMIDELSNFLIAQVHAMDKAIFIESQKVNRNLRLDYYGNETQDFFMNWIYFHAANFNKAWFISVCKKCVHVKNCYNCLKTECSDFKNKI
jgi:hypothetical protein